MRALLIDPKTRDVAVVHMLSYRDGRPRAAQPGDQEIGQAIYALIETDGSPFDVIALSETETMFIDDEALLKLQDGQEVDCIDIPGLVSPLTGRALILGVDDEGDTVASRLPLSLVADAVSFSRRRYGGVVNFEDIMDHPLLGPGTCVIGSRAQFSDPL